ncbi:MAG: hypothetical protein SF069_00810 [Phycisphaerae bacterium]|nr:hypothetical protein [Phycisphaerae bacterium]
MDAQTRHNLKTNELGELIGEAGDFIKTPAFRTTALLVVLGAALALAIWSWRTSSQRSIEHAWQDLYTSQLEAKDPAAATAALREVISRNSDPALLAAARMMLTDQLLRDGFEEDAKLEGACKEAKEMLGQIIADPAIAPQVIAAARFKRASVLETLSDFEGAKADYEALTSSERFAGSPYVAMAEQRMKSLADVIAVKPFAPGSRPVASAPVVTPTGERQSVTLPLSRETPAGEQVEVKPGVTIERMRPEDVPQNFEPLPDAAPQPAPAEAPAPASQPASPAQP